MSELSDKLDERQFFVARIEETEPPQGMSEGRWYQYTIGRGDSAITGIRSGSLQSVKRHAEEFAENLNQRSALGYSAYAARRLQK
ncbi:MAG: hypothetical protein OEN02_10250 [Gammaproteobacteria bacterium]|nr:hypothetical protein [Gammaproteobacteria bacterium]MDH3537914.1 hypothetical protein [Gammaproteobacteria bacterium]